MRLQLYIMVVTIIIRRYTNKNRLFSELLTCGATSIYGDVPPEEGGDCGGSFDVPNPHRVALPPLSLVKTRL